MTGQTESFLFLGLFMCLPKLLQLLLRNILEVLHSKQQTNSHLQFNFSLAVSEAVFPDGGDVEFVVHHSVD